MSVKELYIKRVDPNEIYTIGEVCLILRLSRGAVSNHINSGRLRAERFSGAQRIDIAGIDIVRFINEFLEQV